MSSKDLEQQIIQTYQKDEQMMILIFAQWCINNDLDPLKVYFKAYPDQKTNATLQQAISLTVPKEEAGEIANETLLGVLSLFGNEELAYVITNEIKYKNN